MDAVEKAKCGHPGMPMGMADVATVLFTRFLKFDASAPDWPARDRFVLSAGHGSMVFYALPHLTGYPEMSMDQLTSFRQLGSKKAGHPFRKAGAENLCAKGAYVLAGTADKKRDVAILATGSEVCIAKEARERPAKEGIEAAGVSMPCWELFAAEPVAYRQAVLGAAPARCRRSRRQGRLGAAAWAGRRLHRHGELRRLGPRRASSTSTSALPPPMLPTPRVNC
jgi:transketolase